MNKMNLQENLKNCLQTIPQEVTLVAVSKMHSIEEIQEVYNAGQRHFGENKVQELKEKADVLPNDIHWHQIGHLQNNKVKYIAPFVYLIHSVDSLDLLKTIDKEAKKNNRIINVLLQLKIAKEDTKFGMDFTLAQKILEEEQTHYPNIKIIGLMGMASFVEDQEQINTEFHTLKDFYDKNSEKYKLSVLSMGMSDDYLIAIECGSTMVRVGSKIFGRRNYAQ